MLKTPYTYQECHQTLHDISGAFSRGRELAALLLAQRLLEYCAEHRDTIESATGEALPKADAEK